LQPIQVLAARDQIGGHRELTGVVLAVSEHARMADAAFNRDQVEIDALDFNLSLAQRLKVVIFVAC
jgi:hypothetical protein